MKIFSIETGNIKLDGGAMFGVVPKLMWNKKYPADENNQCNWAMRCLLVDTGNRKILIDTGAGNKQGKEFFETYGISENYSLESSLKNEGYNFEDITDVILTHLHFDHCGGAVKYNDSGSLVPTFPNAVYHVSKSHWEMSLNPNKREKASLLVENFLPLAEYNQLNLITDESYLIPEIYFKIFNGHTEGQLIPYIKYNEKTMAYCGDLFPSTEHIPMSFIMSYDSSPLITLEDKERFFKHAIENNVVLFFEHDIYNECCSLYKTERGVRVKDKFKLNLFLSK